MVAVAQIAVVWTVSRLRFWELSIRRLMVSGRPSARTRYFARNRPGPGSRAKVCVTVTVIGSCQPISFGCQGLTTVGPLGVLTTCGSHGLYVGPASEFLSTN